MDLLDFYSLFLRLGKAAIEEPSAYPLPPAVQVSGCHGLSVCVPPKFTG